jgi:hypothetical protein
MRPDLVSPMVAVLASEACPVTGEIFVAGGGRFARTIFAETPGWIDEKPTPDSVLKNLDTITDDSQVEVITDGVHASAHHAELLGFKPTGPIVVTAGGAPVDPTT